MLLIVFGGKRKRVSEGVLSKRHKVTGVCVCVCVCLSMCQCMCVVHACMSLCVCVGCVRVLAHMWVHLWTHICVHVFEAERRGYRQGRERERERGRFPIQDKHGHSHTNTHKTFSGFTANSTSCFITICLLVGCFTSQQHASIYWDRSCRSNFPSAPVTVYWHWANQSQHWPCNARCLAG